jgi:hypothetical protein
MKNFPLEGLEELPKLDPEFRPSILTIDELKEAGAPGNGNRLYRYRFKYRRTW